MSIWVNLPQPVPIVYTPEMGVTGPKNLQRDIVYLMNEIGETTEDVRMKALKLVDEDFVKFRDVRQLE